MILLDTDHLSVLPFPDHPRALALSARVRTAEDSRVASTIINYEEAMRGWLSEIHRHRDFDKQLPAYERLMKMIDFFKNWEVVPFDKRAASESRRLQAMRLRIGTMDIKIAAIALVHRALLLSANLRDFRAVPGLRVENWLQ